MYTYIYIYVSKFGGCKRQDSPAKRNTVQTENNTTTTKTTTTTTTTTNNNNNTNTNTNTNTTNDNNDNNNDNNKNNNGRCEGENQGSRQILGSAIAPVGRVSCVVCRVASSVARDRWHRPWPAIDGTVRGPRSMAPSVARDRWHHPWPVIDGTVDKT